jgi:hypothetical protein
MRVTQACKPPASRHTRNTSARSNASRRIATSRHEADAFRSFANLHRFKENSMKTSIIALGFAALAAFAASGATEAAESATAATVVQVQQSCTSRVGALQKTRADVRRELAQAQQDGQLAHLRTLYRGS